MVRSTGRRAGPGRSGAPSAPTATKTATGTRCRPGSRGSDDGFFLSRADGSFRLNIHGLLQSRQAWNDQDNSPSGDDDRWGFEIPRARLWFDGNLVSPSWIYKIECNAVEADDGGGFTDISPTARGEWLVAGHWSQVDHLAGWPGRDHGVMLGGAVHWQKGDSGTSGAPNVEVLQWTLDLSVEGDRWDLFTYFVGRHIDDAPGLIPGGSDSRDQHGFVLQGGYLVTDDWEIFGPWEWGDDDNVLAPIVAGTSTDDLSIITIGAT